MIKETIVADGGKRHRQSPVFQERLRDLRACIRARHAAEWSTAGFFRRLMLRWRMAAEFRRERRALEPSRGSLYGSGIALP